MLEKEDVVSFQKMTSCGTDTSLSVPCMFSSLGRSNYSHSKGKNMSNVLDIVSHSGVEVLWLDNNSDSKGVADRVTFKDYGFFVPKDAAGREVIIDGIASLKELDEETAKHFADDSGREFNPETDMKEVSIVASGVLIKKPNQL